MREGEGEEEGEKGEGGKRRGRRLSSSGLMGGAYQGKTTQVGAYSILGEREREGLR